jgi:hypothetical protein
MIMHRVRFYWDVTTQAEVPEGIYRLFLEATGLARVQRPRLTGYGVYRPRPTGAK